MINLYNTDCMDWMRDKPDNYYNLAIVDPPYGININESMGRRKGQKHSGHKKIHWDNAIPKKEYFIELMRVSKNQIIWGGNYFPLPQTGSWIFWDKLMPPEMSFSAGELAWMTFGNTIRKVIVQNQGSKSDGNKYKIHPTQKPVQLYKWLLLNYAKENDKILDTHGGSMSIALACHDLHFDLDLCELDKEYFEAGKRRLNIHTDQLVMI